jgi:NAD(P)-dependent dehydrogenase (short-subunit alcohol dehydrogenase family)
MKLFDGHVAWITGGGSGIGHALALEFAGQGANVALSGRRTDRLEKAAQEVEARGQRALVIPCDVTDEVAVQDAVASIVGGFGRIDVAVANAGMGVMGRVEQLSDAEWRRQFDVNVFGAINTVRHALPELRRVSGRLALVASVSGMMCAPRSGAYSASKFALRAIGLTLSQELQGSGVSCTLLHPGFVASEISQVDNDGVFDPKRRDKRPRLLIWPTDRAARTMLRAIHRRKREYVFTAHGRLGAYLGRHFPGLVHFFMTRSGAQAVTAAAEKKSDTPSKPREQT